MSQENQVHGVEHQHCGHGGEEQRLKEQAHRLEEEGHRLRQEAHELEQQGLRLEEEGHRLEDEAKHLHDCREETTKDLWIIINGMRFDQHAGVKRVMPANAIALLVGGNTQTHFVRRISACGEPGEPLHGDVKVQAGDKFTVTRKHVDGGFESRLNSELDSLRAGGQAVEYHPGNPAYIIYREVPTKSGFPATDVIVQVPSGYPHTMIDRAGLPLGSAMSSQVKGAIQETVNVASQAWSMISYHPHNGGGGPAWDNIKHGFHTYLGEVMSWLAVNK